MEKVLEIYKRPYNPLRPVICMDESPKQLIEETKTPIKMRQGKAAKYDYEYKRHGVCNIFMSNEPLAGKRYVKITKHKTKKDWAKYIKEISKKNKKAEKITLVMDNLNTHKPSSLYETFPPQEAKDLWDRFEFIYTPKHGSWLNMAEIELNVLLGQCLNRRIDNIKEVVQEVQAWETDRNNKNAKINWQFTNKKARIKLKHLYPKLNV